MENIQVYLGMVDSLINSSTQAYNNDNKNYYNHVIGEINGIAKIIHESKYGKMYKFKHLNYESYPDRSDLMVAISILRQMKSFLANASGQKLKEAEELILENKRCNNRIADYERKEKTYLEIIKKSKTASEYVTDEEKLKLFSENNLMLIKEALDSYSVGAYTACACVCRTILQELVQKLCKKNNISEGSLKSQINKLVENKVIKKEHHPSLLDITKFFGHRASHPTTEIFDRTKANLVLSSLFILNEEMMQK
ncbi:DUF4145 domain-containing protein [Candidatus Pacearchaeota archaeon]|nr:DUF4145 domain-containing protein [Candidatus Pacearchaeota archaeon]